jgi:Tol biopolymer transport system component
MTDTTARGMTADDLYRITYAGDAQISPDGTRVAYVQTRMDKEKDEYLSNIWVVPTAGGAPVQFTSGARRDTSPRWSPDGRWLAFLSNRASESKQKDAKDEKDQKNQIWVMPTDGGEARKLTSLKSGAGSIAWSPDSGRIAFTSRVSVGDDRDDDEADKDSQGGKNGGGEAKAKKTARARVITTLKYKLNGEGFTYDRRPHIFVVSVDASGSSDSSASKEGSEPRQITEGDFNDQAPTWSPDGKLIAFTSARHDERDFNGVSDIFVVSADGGEPRQVTQGRGPSHDASFSPDGKTLLRHLRLGHGRRARGRGRRRRDSHGCWRPACRWVLVALGRPIRAGLQRE